MGDEGDRDNLPKDDQMTARIEPKEEGNPHEGSFPVSSSSSSGRREEAEGSNQPSGEIPADSKNRGGEGGVTHGRLIIHKVVLENFKSYGGRTEIGPFHKSLTSIIGPNGSGKSNIIDALLFVFGKKASDMRLKNVAELVHRSPAHPNVHCAKVEVHFTEIIDKPGSLHEYQTIPGREMVVSREAYKVEKEKNGPGGGGGRRAAATGSSKYFLNGTGSSFTEVTRVLKEKGIDLEHNRFLILQGEVEQIALMKPKGQSPNETGFLEYLEDIIGTNRHATQLEELLNEREAKKEQTTEIASRLQHVVKDMEELEGPCHETLEYLKNERSMLHNRGLLVQLDRLGYKKKLQIALEAVKGIEERLEMHRQSRSGVERRKKEVEKELALESKKCRKLQEEAQAAMDRYLDLEKKDAEIRANRKNEQKRIDKLLALEKKEREKAELCPLEAERMVKEAERMDDEMAPAEKARIKESVALAMMQKDIKAVTENLSQKKDAEEVTLQQVQAKYSELKSAFDEIEAEKDLLIRKGDMASAELENLTKETANCEEMLSEKEKTLKTISSNIITKSKSIEQERKKFADLKSQYEATFSTVAQKKAKLEEMKASVKADQVRSTAISGILKRAQTGRLKGVRGRLGDLGTIDSKYDLAISTACPHLDNIVVETMEDAEACVEVLLKESLGRCTFIDLRTQNQNYRDLDRRSEFPEGVPRLFDLIKTAPEYKAAFYYRVRDTLVAKDLEQARRIAFGPQRFRVVSLDGNIIEPSGTMTGGGSNKIRGGMRTQAEASGQPQEISALEEQYSKNAEFLQRVKNEMTELDASLSKSTAEMEELERAQGRAKTAIGQLEKQVADFNGRLKEKARQGVASVEEKKKIKELEEQVRSRTQGVESAGKKLKEAQTRVKDLQDKIMNAGGEEMRAQKEKAAQADSRVEELRSGAAKLKAQASAAEKKQKECEKSANDARDKAAEAKEKIAELTKEYETLESLGVQLLEQRGRAGDVHAEQQKVVDEVKGKLDSVDAEIAEMGTLEVQMDSELEDSARLVKDAQSKVGHYTKELNSLRREYDQLRGLSMNGQASDDKKKKKKAARNQEPTDEDEHPKEKEATDGEEEAHVAEAEDSEMTSQPDDEGEEMTMDDVAEDKLENMQKSQIEGEVACIQAAGASLKPDMVALENYRAKQRQQQALLEELRMAQAEHDKARDAWQALWDLRLAEFSKGFAQISKKLKEMYQMLTLGGDAELEVMEPTDPFDQGVVFSVRPPKKSWKQIQNLSGGEKTLSSLALVFALHDYRPTPLYFLDEIDAALDYRNVAIIANYIKERTEDAQFTIISLRNEMFELADRLVGVYKTDDVTKSIAITPDECVAPGGPKVRILIRQAA